MVVCFFPSAWPSVDRLFSVWLFVRMSVCLIVRLTSCLSVTPSYPSLRYCSDHIRPFTGMQIFPNPSETDRNKRNKDNCIYDNVTQSQKLVQDKNKYQLKLQFMLLRFFYKSIHPCCSTVVKPICIFHAWYINRHRSGRGNKTYLVWSYHANVYNFKHKSLF